MSWNKSLFGAGLLVAGLINQAGAQTSALPVAALPGHKPAVTTTSPPVYGGGPVYSQPSGPGCLPGTIVPPGTAVPPGTLPGTTPGTMPGDAGALAGAAASGAGVAGGGGEGGSGSLTSGAPNMIGDLGSRGVSTVRSSRVSYSNGFDSFSRLQALVGAGSFKIAENESPRPQNRFFLTYNYYNGVNTFGGPQSQFDVHRQVIGFERTFLDGNASVGMRLPFLQRAQAEGNNTVDGVGDLSVILKYAFINDRMTGNVASGGVVITAPTGRDVILSNGTNIQSWLIQPWGGFILGGDRLFTQGFFSGIIPTDSTDACLLSTDIGLGYRLYTNSNGGLLTAVVPTVEAHLLTPLSKRGVGDVINGSALVGIPDQLVLTGGVHLGLWDRAWLTLAAAAPVTGPRLFDFEGVVQFNFIY